MYVSAQAARMSSESFRLCTPEQTERLGRAAADGVKHGQVVFLCGDLGAGKTTWVRGVLKGLGHEGAVKSPTYTLLEPYYLGDLNVFHFDLYRLSDPVELENLGFRDYLDGSGVCFIEWPERGAGLLPQPDCRIEIKAKAEGRELTAVCASDLGESLCASMH